MKCVGCGKEQGAGVCSDCLRHVMDMADRERIPLVGNNRPEARRIGFTWRSPSGDQGGGER